MESLSDTYTRRHLVLLTLLAWLAMLGFDLLLHGGVLARLYLEPSPFLLPPLTAFRLIPLGYLSFLLLAVLLTWLMVRLEITGWHAGALFGLQLGALTWGALVLGLLSISTASPMLMAGWFLGQTLEMAAAGAVIGSGLAGAPLRRLLVVVILFVVLAVVITFALQTLGVVPTMRLP